jgi:hypothetical protein
VLVGGDVAPSAVALIEVFEAIEGGADAAIAPAPDGGVSLLALAPGDLDLLGGIRQRRRTLLRDLLHALSRRGRRVRLVAPAADVDGRRSLRLLLRGTRVPGALFALARLVLCPAIGASSRSELLPRPRALANPSGLRAPPLRRSA